eukprot:GDKI01023920.1.p1 GENE.GDKI01023920.1~~GDKI01023920.1.p1  ORF type:complete len:101 (+),score=32.30 GDKI01023920.1:144-446(+)
MRNLYLPILSLILIATPALAQHEEDAMFLSHDFDFWEEQRELQMELNVTTTELPESPSTEAAVVTLPPAPVTEAPVVTAAPTTQAPVVTVPAEISTAPWF